MKRIAEHSLGNWLKSKGRKPLVIDGARQVGKSYLVEQLFAPSHFEKVLKLDFMENPKLNSIFDGDLTPDVILREIQLATGQKFDPEFDLLFFEEVGLCQRAIDSLKYFYQDRPEIVLIATGSNIGLLGSFPVGKVNRLAINPLTFKEFLWANGLENLAEIIEIPSRETISQLTHDQLWEQLLKYYFVGGMPEAVREWISYDRNTEILEAMDQVRKIHRELISAYKNDFGKYSKGQKYNALQITRVFESIPSQLMKEQEGSAPKYKFRGVLPGNRSYEDLVGPINFLEKIGVVQRIFIIEGKPKIPLNALIDESRFKLVLHDIGLLNTLLGLSYQDIVKHSYDFKGYISENFAANEFVAEFDSPETEYLFSWVSKRNAELEFIVNSIEKGIVPIEVKSGRSIKSKSLSVYVKTNVPQQAFKLTGRLSTATKEGMVKELPLYMAGSLYQSLVKRT
ncbi:MAG: ATP-binding protein [Gammaproteobacteria bacterium]|nr:MAG: ATP-binding protein [Gammaproteobacteria bacterium]